MNETMNIDGTLSIGELSRLTGIGTHTLRVWEKRYGAPHSERLPSGHRRYSAQEIPRLKAVARALNSGYRASKVATGTLDELQNLLGEQTDEGSESGREDSKGSPVSRDLTLDQWIASIQHFKDESLIHGLHETWEREGPLNFVLDFVTPFIERLGNGWFEGRLTVGQEHFATALLLDFLNTKWRQMNIRQDGPVAVLSTLPRETHNVGLAMCAVVTGLAGYKVVFLGPDSPVEDILETVQESDAKMLCLSVSGCADPGKAERQIRQIRKLLARETQVVVGGQGAPDPVPGVFRFDDFYEFYQWLSETRFRQGQKSSGF